MTAAMLLPADDPESTDNNLSLSIVGLAAGMVSFVVCQDLLMLRQASWPAIFWLRLKSNSRRPEYFLHSETNAQWSHVHRNLTL